MNHNISFNFVPIRITKNTMTIKMKEAFIPYVTRSGVVRTVDLMTGIITCTFEDGDTIQSMVVYKKYLNDERKSFGNLRVIPELRSLKPIIYIKWD